MLLIRFAITIATILVIVAMVWGHRVGNEMVNLTLPAVPCASLSSSSPRPPLPPPAVPNEDSNREGYRKKVFKFHIYDIPSKYISGALKDLEVNWHRSVCNRDAKKKTNYTMLDWRHAHSLFTVDTFIARYMRYHPQHTDDKAEADVFIIPAMTHLYNCAGKMEYLTEILNWVASQPGDHWKRYHAHDHYIFWWRWGMHYGQTIRFFKHLTRLFPRINYISYEFLELMGRNKFQDFSLALKPKFTESMHSVIVPYPDFSPGLKNVVAADTRRDIAVFMSGTSTIGGVRRWIKKELTSHAGDVGFKCVYQDFGSHVVDTKRLGVPVDYPEMFKRSVFCVHAAGDGLSSRRPTSAVLSGCIPVLVCDLCVYPFEGLLNYTAFAVFMPEEDVISGRMVDILKAIPQADIVSKRKALLSIRRHFTYNPDGPPLRNDALDTVVQSLEHRSAVLNDYKRWFYTHPDLSTNMKDYPPDPPLRNRYKVDLADDPTQVK
eukprot:TRINITY_DN24430_c0_g1_i1.p1 TRINITY_DN24430_c0_g1~~TRINITY_DN24430_c0_g1_i1.p1  ORF type:complete len:503 (+),score=78.38 TRINITY_DN24430_c0_g1_i1:42-1511(+)